MRAVRLYLSLFLFLISAASWAGEVAVQHLRLWRAPDHTRLVFDTSGPAEHRLFLLQDPQRIVIDIDNAHVQGSLPELDTSGSLIAAIRTGKSESGALRVVIDLKSETKPRSFALKPAGEYGYRLVVDLYDAKALDEDARSARDEDAKPAAPVPGKTPPNKPIVHDLIVAIDAGHGGDDPGAIGRRYRTREKDVTLAIAQELAKLVAQTPGMRPMLIRNGDYYVGLRERFSKARRQRADVFVSIHADAVPGRNAHGSSVYALSEKGASNAMARQLADKENASDLIGGVSLSDKDDMLAKVLLDLSHNRTIQDSVSLGDDVLAELRHVGPVHMGHVAQAGFAVLKSPDIPSVLVETAFISNPSEEKKLRTPAFQQQLAKGIFQGVKRFLARTATSRTQTIEANSEPRAASPQEHVVRPGETLASIAKLYNIHVEALRFLNDLRDKDPPIGLKLRIPPKSSDS